MNNQLVTDPKKYGKVAVLMGGRSAEREVSLLSGAAVLAALKSAGVDAHAFDTGTRSILELKAENFDRCHIALHGRYGEDGTLQGALELLGIPYTGSGVLASSVAMNKIVTKRIWQSLGLPTPQWLEVTSAYDTERAFEQLGPTMIVKPAREGSTIGLTKVTNLNECRAAYEAAAQQDSIVLCEQFISGDEVTCTVVDTYANQVKTTLVLPIIKICAPDGNYDYNNKYIANDTKYMLPSGLPFDEEENIKNIVLKAYSSIGCRSWARADVMIDDATRQPYLLEINTSPGMTSHSLAPMSAKAAGYSFEGFCLQLLDAARLDY